MYWFYRFLAFLLRLIPLKFAYWLWLRVCDLAYFLNPRGRRAVRDHLRTIFTHQGIQPTRRLLDGCTRKTFQSFGKYLADFIRFRKLTPDNLRAAVSLQGAEHLDAIRNSPNGAILLTAHYGNWELGGAFIVSYGIPLHAIARPVDSPALERLFNHFRRQRGLQVIPMDRPARILKALKRGEAVALTADRDFTGNGTPQTFFGRNVSLPRGAAWFAHRTGTPIYMGFAIRAPDDSFILRLQPPNLPAEYDRENAIQQQINRIMEETISADPTQWFIFDPFWNPAPQNTSTSP